MAGSATRYRGKVSAGEERIVEFFLCERREGTVTAGQHGIARKGENLFLVVLELLGEMRRRHVREAIVIDEYGGTAGLVTIESLVERIIGDIGGEFGGSARIVSRTDGSADIDGLTLVGDMNTQFGLHIDETAYTTVGGYVLGRLGRRARVGDTVDVEGRRMRVEQLDGLRVARVWLSKPFKSTTTKVTEEEHGGHG